MAPSEAEKLGTDTSKWTLDTVKRYLDATPAMGSNIARAYYDLPPATMENDVFTDLCTAIVTEWGAQVRKEFPEKDADKVNMKGKDFQLVRFKVESTMLNHNKWGRYLRDAHSGEDGAQPEWFTKTCKSETSDPLDSKCAFQRLLGSARAKTKQKTGAGSKSKNDGEDQGGDKLDTEQGRGRTTTPGEKRKSSVSSGGESTTRSVRQRVERMGFTTPIRDNAEDAQYSTHAAQRYRLDDCVLVLYHVSQDDGGRVHATMDSKLCIEDALDEKENIITMKAVHRASGLSGSLDMYSGGSRSGEAPRRLKSDADFRAHIKDAFNRSNAHDNAVVALFFARHDDIVGKVPEDIRMPPFTTILNHWRELSADEPDVASISRATEPRSTTPTPQDGDQQEAQRRQETEEAQRRQDTEEAQRRQDAEEARRRQDAERARRVEELEEARKRRVEEDALHKAETDARRRTAEEAQRLEAITMAEKRKADENAQRKAEADALRRAAEDSEKHKEMQEGQRHRQLQASSGKVSDTQGQQIQQIDLTGDDEPEGQDLQIEDAALRACFANQDNFPMMVVPRLEDLRVTVTDPRRRPAVVVPNSFRFEVNKHHTSKKYTRIDPANTGALAKDPLLTHFGDRYKVSFDPIHLDHDIWRRETEFFGFDPDVGHPRVGVTFTGWKRRKALKALQMHTVAVVLQRFFSGHNLMVITHDMGIGKTACALAVSGVLRNLARKSPIPSAVTSRMPQDWRDKYFKPSTLVNQPVPDSEWNKIGPTLVVTVANTIPSWIEQIKDFTDRGRKVVVLGATRADGAYLINDRVEEEDLYEGWMDEWDRRPTVRELLDTRCSRLTKDVIRRNPLFDKDNIDKSEEHVPNTAQGTPNPKDRRGRRKFIEGKEYTGDDSDMAWQNDWFVLSSYHVIGQRTEAIPPDQPYVPVREGILSIAYSIIIVDETQKEKGWTNQSWKAIAQTHGNAYVLAMSATPYTKFSDTFAYMLAGEHRHYAAEVKGTSMESEWIYQSMAGKRPDTKVMKWRTTLSTSASNIVKQIDIPTFIEACDRVDKYNVKKAAAAGGVVKAKDDIADADYETIAQVIGQKMVGVKSGFVWKPFAGAPGLPAIDFRPHTTYNLYIGIPGDYRPYMAPLWKAIVKSTLEYADTLGLDPKMKDSIMQKTKDKFLNLARLAIIFSVLPALPKLFCEYRDVLREWDKGNCRVEVALANARKSDPTTLAIWEHMDEIEQQPAMRALADLVRQTVTAQRRTIKGSSETQKRKAIVTAFSGTIIAVVKLWIRWHINKGTGKAKLGIESEEQVSFLDTTNTREERSKIVNETKQPNKRLLVAQGPCISEGLNLIAFDMMVCLDLRWETFHHEQKLGRIRRPATVQPSLFTEAFTFVATESWFNVQGWMIQRREHFELAAERIREELEALQGSCQDDAGDEAEEADLDPHVAAAVRRLAHLTGNRTEDEGDQYVQEGKGDSDLED